MKMMVRKWGNSASVRIPAAVMQAAQMELGQAVDVREERGKVIIEPIRSGMVSLDTLLSLVTPENLHGSIDFGPRRGREVW